MPYPPDDLPLWYLLCARFLRKTSNCIITREAIQRRLVCLETLREGLPRPTNPIERLALHYMRHYLTNEINAISMLLDMGIIGMGML